VQIGHACRQPVATQECSADIALFTAGHSGVPIGRAFFSVILSQKIVDYTTIQKCVLIFHIAFLQIHYFTVLTALHWISRQEWIHDLARGWIMGSTW